MPERREFLELMGAAGGLFAAGGLAPRARASEDAAPAPDTAALLKVALLQMAPNGSDQQANLKKADQFCRQAAKAGADMAMMPEMWNIGYTGFVETDQETTKRWRSRAVPRDGKWVGHFRKLAKEMRMAIVVTYLEEWNGAPRNSLCIIDRNGEIILDYAKVHTCDFAFEAALTPGEGWGASSLDTAKGTVQVGAMICYDREFPESARSLMLAGAELVVTPNACLLDDLRIAQFQVRAHENAMAMAMTNYPAPINNGRSVAFDPAGLKVAEGGEKEDIVYANFNLGSIRFYRERTIWGHAWRRPHRYGALTQDPNLPVFKRVNMYGNAFKADER